MALRRQELLQQQSDDLLPWCCHAYVQAGAWRYLGHAVVKEVQIFSHYNVMSEVGHRSRDLRALRLQHLVVHVVPVRRLRRIIISRSEMKMHASFAPISS